MASRSQKSSPARAFSADKHFPMQPWHHGEPTESWWLAKDRESFAQAAKAEAPRIIRSSMARRIDGMSIYDPK